MTPLNVLDFEPLARERMDHAAFEYYAGAAGDETTLAENRRAFGDYVFKPRALVDVSHVDLDTTVVGEHVSMPILLAPTAFHKLAHPDGEPATARAAARAKTLLVASTLATTRLEDIAAAAAGPLWFQLYVYRDRAVTEDLVRRAEAAGYRALVLTVDAPRLGRRERDLRNGFVLPDGLTMANFLGLDERLPSITRWGKESSFATYVHELFDPSLTWDAVASLKALTQLPILVKGVLRGDDARRAVEAGAAGVIVSNHGGRQLDGTEATVRALPEVVAAVEGRAEVLMDGGVRRGTDVLKALALGARAVLVGRPYLWGLAARGEDGVFQVLQMLRAELELAMALAGSPSVSAIAADLVRPLRGVR